MTTQLAIFDLWNTLIVASGPRFVQRIAQLVSDLTRQSVSEDAVTDFIRATGCLHQEIEVEDLAVEFFRYHTRMPPPLSLASRTDREHREFVAGASFLSGAGEALVLLREAGLQTAVVSNATSASIEVVERLQIRDLVDEVWLSCQSGYLKPDPRAFTTVAAHFQATPSTSCVVGDKMTTDVLGARLAGMHAVLIDPALPEPIIRPNGSMLAVAPSVLSVVGLLKDWAASIPARGREL